VAVDRDRRRSVRLWLPARASTAPAPTLKQTAPVAGGQVVFHKQGRIASGLLLGPIWAQHLPATAFTTQATSWPVSRRDAILHYIDFSSSGVPRRGLAALLRARA